MNVSVSFFSILRTLCGALLWVLFLPFFGQAQNTSVIFPGLSGKILLDSLFDRYRPDTVLPYAVARDTLYAKVLAIDDDTVRCIYTGMALYLDPSKDPTQYVYLNGSANGMNAEHAYPQGKGTGTGNARSDMHHVYPVRIAVNEIRGDLPYLDIPDQETDRWYRGTQFVTSIPASRRDEYSEYKPGRFEPKEASKGDLARAVFYIQTMYRVQTNAADPNFFETQRLTLCQWHGQDPADAAEIRKTQRIARYQGTPNPFVLDCTLAYRCWCEDVRPQCVSDVTPAPAIPLQLHAQCKGQGAPMEVAAYLPFAGNVSVRLTDMQGRLVGQYRVEHAPEGRFSHFFKVETTAAQMFLVEMSLSNGVQTTRQIIKTAAF